MTTLAQRDAHTARTAGGVYVRPGHWASISVHAFRTHVNDRELLTWCGLTVDLGDGARQTTDTISCLACGQASLDAWWGRGRR